MVSVGASCLLVTAQDTNKVYGTCLSPTDYTVAGLMNGDSVTNVVLGSPGSATNAAVGSYPITATLVEGLGLPIYVIGYSNGVLTVNAAGLLITAQDTNKVYGTELLPTEYAVAGLMNGDSVTNLTLSSDGTESNAPVGSYPINASSALGVGLTNYVIC